MDEARKLLDSLMGSHRNIALDDAKRRQGTNFTDANVCKHFLVGFCPQHEELFHSTKRDLGACKKVHSDALKEEFEAHNEKEKYRLKYERQLREYLEDVVRGADEWVAREKRNVQWASQQIAEKAISKAQVGAQSTPEEIEAAAEKAAWAVVQEAERLAEAGEITASRAKLAEAEEVRNAVKAKAKGLSTGELDRPVPTGDDVCDICGLRTEAGDEARRQSHLMGKIHMGYALVRKKLSDLRQKEREQEKKAAAEGSDGADSKGEKERKRDRDRTRDRDRDRDRDRERTRDRDRADRDRRERDRDRSRERRR